MGLHYPPERISEQPQGYGTSVFRVAVMACLLLLVAFFAQGCGLQTPDRVRDVQRNKQLLADVPPFPGSVGENIASSRERESETGTLSDHYTTVRAERFSIRIPLRRAQAWYRRHLEQHGWRVRTFWEERVADNPPPGVQTIGRRGKALIDVSLTPIRGAVDVQILADFLGNRLCRHPTDVGCW
jgi:hypothetical protein